MANNKRRCHNRKVTVNIPDWLNKEVVGEVNFSHLLSDELRSDIKRHQENKGDGQLVKKTLTVDEELVLLAKAYNINLSQCLYKALCKYMDAKECIHKFKK